MGIGKVEVSLSWQQQGLEHLSILWDGNSEFLPLNKLIVSMKLLQEFHRSFRLATFPLYDKYNLYKVY